MKINDVIEPIVKNLDETKKVPSEVLAKYYTSLMRGYTRELDKRIADTKQALITNKNVASRASMRQNIEDLELEKKKTYQYYKDKYGID